MEDSTINLMVMFVAHEPNSLTTFADCYKIMIAQRNPRANYNNLSLNSVYPLALSDFWF